MSDVIRKTTNKWTKGLVMDFSPENTRNEILTHALNATLLTFNGNELSLQNDMGNARVETAFLPEGYIPVGTCEYGGIIYIVSYNPLEDKSQIGCFPSPERNISNKELGKSDAVISKTDFQEYVNGELTGNLISPTKYVLLKEDNLNPGDKFLIGANDTIYQEKLSDLQIVEGEGENRILNPIEHPIIALNVVSIEDSGKIIYLNSDLCKYDIEKKGKTYNYHIVGEMGSDSEISQEKLDPDSYRNVLKSGYNVFKSKTSGKLAILAELLTIDSYAVTHSLQPSVDESGNVLEGQFDIIIHSEIEPKITESNYMTSPKLKYYYLKNSQGYIQTDVNQSNQVELFKGNKENPEFFKIKLSDVYVPISQDDASITKELEETLKSDDFSFELPNTYHARKNDDNTFADFIPKQGDSISYPDVKLASIKIPEFVSKNGLDLPFKYDYTLVPCMNYGKLDHLAVSNTVDFSKLHAFNQSNFTTWKYHIDENQLRLNFGADIFDTYETDKVDALILEFYDCWGFAGSMILSDKRSYSGVFTKIIPLNTLGALSSYKINSTLPFKRNINIVQDVDKSFKFNGKPVTFTEDGGWKYENGHYLEDNNNDCGTLYPNLIYGVKAYLRRTINKGNLETEHYEYIKKRDMFLYTLPIYNDFYYTTDDFNTLVNPQLRFVLTFRLEDSSVKEIYNENTINKGYSISDLSFIEKYLNGRLEDNIYDVDVIKYYKYKGSSKLQLEIGLQKEYQDIYLSYSSDLNKYFTCNLRLISNESENSTFSVVSKATTPELALQYINKDGQLDLKLNSITFDASAEPSVNQEISIEDGKFKNLNFINTADVENPTYIPINYEFVVGYKASITDIRATEVSATTACALFHNNKGNYNYEDFGVYEKIDQDESGVVEYLSAAAFYNEGSKETEIFGICKQLKAAVDGNINSHWQSYDSIEKEATKITTPTKFNTGSSLKYLIPHIGKYTFCQPYVPPLSDEYATNLFAQDLGNVSQLVIESDFTIHDSYKEYPRYSLVLNTQSSIRVNSEFIATIPYSIQSGLDSRVYSTFTGKDIEVFNRAMLKTMSKVYVYNPDYDSLEVNVGNVTVTDNGIQFISNLLSTDSKFDLPTGTSLNDYIYLGTMQVSKYLCNLENHSRNGEDYIKSFDDERKPVPQIAFTPNYLYCGTPEANYLVTTLTYNTPKPAELEAELAFDSVPGVVARHSDGSVDLISGEINKNSFYGYNENNNLVQLDVSNYTIDSNGDLTIGKEAYGGEQKEAILIDKDRLRGNSWDVTFVGEKDVLSTIPVTLEFSFGHTKTFEDWIVVGIESTADDKYKASIKPKLRCDSSEYFTELIEMEVEECKGSVLFSDYWGSSGKYFIGDQEPETWFNLATKKEGNVIVKPKKLGGEQESLDPSFNIVSVQQLAATITPFHNLKNETIELYTNISSDDYSGAVYALKLRSLTFRISKKKNIEGIKNSVISCMKTKHYSDLLDNVYRILPMYDSARLRGTSLTLNDLYYDSSDFNHRLFVREGLVSNITNRSNKVCFREVDKDLDKDSVNYILLQTGPCFTKDNL